jgi:ribonuclease T1
VWLSASDRSSSTVKGVQRWLSIVALAAVLGLFGSASSARGPAQGADTVALSALPPEAQQVQRLIYAGGPFRYDKDGTVFFNRERLLPRQPRGYWREYTVPTPRARNRGARRIVCGGEQPTKPEACYYTADHYASFQRIVP